MCSGRHLLYYKNKGYDLPYAKDSRGRTGVRRGSRIEVLTEDLPKFSQVKIKYQCDDCGNIKEVNAQTILGRKNSQYNKTGETICNRCANKRMSGENSGAYKHGSKRYPEYRNNARKRNINFGLTVDDFEEIVKLPCHYCGGFSIDRFENSRGNGIDRKNSDEDYSINNCVPCCRTCNFIKNSIPYVDFITYIRNVYNHTRNYEI